MLFCCACLAFLPGCWDYIRINDRAFVIGISVDPDPDHPGQMRFSFQVPQFARAQPSPDQSGEQAGGALPARNFSASAESLNEAMSIAQLQSEKTLFLGMLQTVILSERLSEQQIRSVVSELVRNTEVDKLAFLVTTPGSAADLLQERDPTGRPAADVIDQLLGPSERQVGYGTRSRLWEFWRDMISPGTAPRTVEMVTGERGIEVSGITAFSGTKPVLTLNRRQAVAYNLLAGQLKQVAVVVPTSKGDAVIRVMRSECTMSTHYRNGRYELIAVAKLEAQLVKAPLDEEMVTGQTDIHAYEAAAGRALSTWCTELVKDLQEKQSDILGFGRLAQFSYPDRTDWIRSHWPAAFADAKPSVSVSVTLSTQANFA